MEEEKYDDGNDATNDIHQTSVSSTTSVNMPGESRKELLMALIRLHACLPPWQLNELRFPLSSKVRASLMHLQGASARQNHQSTDTEGARCMPGSHAAAAARDADGGNGHAIQDSRDAGGGRELKAAARRASRPPAGASSGSGRALTATNVENLAAGMYQRMQQKGHGTEDAVAPTLVGISHTRAEASRFLIPETADDALVSEKYKTSWFTDKTNSAWSTAPSSAAGSHAPSPRAGSSFSTHDQVVDEFWAHTVTLVNHLRHDCLYTLLLRF